MTKKVCPLCGSFSINEEYVMNYTDLLDGMGEKIYSQEIYSCDKCNMVWVNNPIDSSSLDEYYKKLSKYEPETIVGKQDASKEKMFKRQFAFIESRIDDYESVLEIGAATGANLNYYKIAGKRVVGIEPSTTNKQYAVEKYGIDMYDMTFDEYMEELTMNIGGDKKCDLIFLSHILEHIVDFFDFMKKAVEISNKYIFIEIPFLENMGTMLEPYGLFTNEHVNYFTFSSLKTLMNKYDCHIIASNIELNVGGESPGYPTLITLWNKGLVADDKYMTENVLSANTLIKQYIEKSENDFQRIRELIDNIGDNEKLAIWGTGAHTSKLLSMTSLASKNIVKFYDSDKKKQLLTMLGKEIESFSKNDIENGEIETILISSFGSERIIRNSIENECIKVPFKVICLYMKE